jgi:hypothetical protein
MNPYALLGCLLTVVLVAGGAYYQGRQDGAAKVRSELAEQLAQKQAEVDRKDADYRARAAELAKATETVGRLLSYRPDPKVLTREVIREVPVDAPCTCPDRSPEYRLQYNAVADGRPPTRPAGAVPAAADDAGVQAP